MSEGALQPLIKNLKAARKNVQAILILTSTKVLALLVQKHQYGRKLWNLLQEQAAAAPRNFTQFTCFTSTKVQRLTETEASCRSRPPARCGTLR